VARRGMQRRKHRIWLVGRRRYHQWPGSQQSRTSGTSPRCMPGVAPLWPPDVGRGPLWCVVVVEVATAATTPVVAIATATATTTVTAPTAIEGVGVVGANVAFGGTIGCRWRRRKGASLLRCNTSYQKGSLGSALVVCLAGILLCENEFTGFNERGEFRKE
jgi:hypothetical protein